MYVEKIISQMTVEEKLKLLVGVGLPGMFENKASRVPGAAGETHQIERLKIPSTVHADGPAGLRIDPERENDSNKYYATAFPIASMLASTWNKEILFEVGKAMGNEAKEYGVDFLLAPAINIHRNPLCGRNFEYYSEDPILAGELASAFVEGVQSEGVGTSLKHFVANNQETNRMKIDTIVSERALREIYLKGFEIVVKKAKPWTVMSAYNKLNGKYCSQNEWLLTKVLREECGFDGFVMSDWFAGDNPVEQIKAGNDLIMPGKTYNVFKNRKDEIEELKLAYEKGEITDEIINERVRAILNILVKTLSFKRYKYSNAPDFEKHSKISYNAASEGVVLLKNNNVLPFSDDAKVSIFGTGQIETVKGGFGSGDTHPRYTINIFEGFKEKGVKVDEKIGNFYKEKVFELRNGKYKPNYVNEFNLKIPPKLPEDILDESMIDKASETNDLAIIVISRISGEFVDRKAVKGDYYLSDDERKLIENVSKKFHSKRKKVIVLLNIGGPIEIASWIDLVDGLLLIWQPGQEAGRVVADVCLGIVNPSGKLPTTFPKDYQDIPSKSFPGKPVENPLEVVYEEDIFVGYRYYDTFQIDTLFEFGYGLSYTKFDYRNLIVKHDEENVEICFEIENSGNVEGKEIAQVYVKAPKVRLDKPFQELKGFYKTKMLKPGEKEKVSIKIALKDLTSFCKDKWVLEEGEYRMRVGASSRDIRLEEKVFLKEKVFNL
ncbi:beta-glucosidase [Thermosipho globiformans]|uniref:beta-glucosidase n=1 Tax=Thermosipho globiformans TaxID=380685 RepID=UPI000F8DCAD7|nr:beta-glucosidase [Thermosipho globiformans]